MVLGQISHCQLINGLSITPLGENLLLVKLVCIKLAGGGGDGRRLMAAEQALMVGTRTAGT